MYMYSPLSPIRPIPISCLFFSKKGFFVMFMACRWYLCLLGLPIGGQNCMVFGTARKQAPLDTWWDNCRSMKRCRLLMLQIFAVYIFFCATVHILDNYWFRFTVDGMKRDAKMQYKYKRYFRCLDTCWICTSNIVHSLGFKLKGCPHIHRDTKRKVLSIKRLVWAVSPKPRQRLHKLKS